jgi:hypothetical protein
LTIGITTLLLLGYLRHSMIDSIKYGKPYFSNYHLRSVIF